MLEDFLASVRGLIVAKRWDQLQELLDITRDFMTRPRAVLTLGKAQDK